jgi:site-specific DNA recombinase
MVEIKDYKGREQSYVKHVLLEQYLETLVHKTASAYPRIVYVDGFAGPWQNSNEQFEDTSFGIALRALRRAKASWKAIGRDVKMTALLVEKNAAAYKQLETLPPKFPDVAVVPLNGDFISLIPTILTKIPTDAFAFFLLDPKGWVPLGYDRKDRTLMVNEAETKTVRTIFELFLKLKSVRDVQNELARLDLRTKPFLAERGRAIGNLPFARGHIYRILSNRLYVGEINHKGINHPGQHPALISKKTWDAVQALLAANRHANRSRSNVKSISLLAGLIFDATGKRLVSSHTTKNGKRYRYYVTSAGAGRTIPTPNLDTLRISAAQVEDVVHASVSSLLTDKQRISSLLRKHRYSGAEIGRAFEVAGQLAHVLATGSSSSRQALISDLVSRVTVTKTCIKIGIKLTQLRAVLSNRSEPSEARKDREPDIILEAQFKSPSRGPSTKLLTEASGGSRSEPDPVVVKAVARARWWFEQLVSGRSNSMAEIAARENITDNYVSNLIHLAWLPPRQIDLILDGDARATRLAKISMLTRSVDLIWKT